jgi:hypothetical protein
VSAATPGERRRFGLTVGGVFLVLGVLSRARGHTTAPLVLWTLGVLLVVPALVAPAVLGPVQRVWMSAAGLLGEVNSRIILTVVFYGLFAPVGFVLRRIRDPLDRSWRDGATSTWVPRPREPVDRERYERQF